MVKTIGFVNNMLNKDFYVICLQKRGLFVIFWTKNFILAFLTFEKIASPDNKFQIPTWWCSHRALREACLEDLVHCTEAEAKAIRLESNEASFILWCLYNSPSRSPYRQPLRVVANDLDQMNTFEKEQNCLTIIIAGDIGFVKQTGSQWALLMITKTNTSLLTSHNFEQTLCKIPSNVQTSLDEGKYTWRSVFAVLLL